MKFFIGIVAAMCSVSVQAQTSLQQILASIEANNTMLRASRQKTEAEKLQQRTTANWENPEVEFGYLWGGPAAIGKRKDISISQSVDLATLGGQRKRLANAQNQMEDLRYEGTKRNVLSEAGQCWLELVYNRARLSLQQKRTEQARQLAGIQQHRLATGEGNAIERNQVQLDLLDAEAKLMQLESEGKMLEAQLETLNGGKSIEVLQDTFDTVLLPQDFDAWLADAEPRLNDLAMARQDITVARRQVALNKAEGLPSISLGYMGEFTRDERYQGATLGVSVPLWSNKNKVKQAKMAEQAAVLKEQDLRMQLTAQLRALYLRTAGLQQTAERYRQSDTGTQGITLLQKALTAGELSVIDYLVAAEAYRNHAENALDAMYEFQKSWLQLMVYTW